MPLVSIEFYGAPAEHNLVFFSQFDNSRVNIIDAQISLVSPLPSAVPLEINTEPNLSNVHGKESPSNDDYSDILHCKHF